MFWGLYFGVLIAAERLFLNRALEALPRVVSHVYLLFAVVVGWALFYFEDLGRLRDFLALLFGASAQPGFSPELTPLILNNALWLVLALVLCVPIVPRLRERARELASRTRAGPTLVGSSIALINLGMLLIATAMLVGGTYNPFLYFRF